MIEQDGFVTTYDSHDRRILAEIFNAKPAESTSPTQHSEKSYTTNLSETEKLESMKRKSMNHFKFLIRRKTQ